MDQGSTDRLLALGKAFAARLEKDAAQLRSLATPLEVQSVAERAQVLEDIRSTAHRLRGTAPAFDAADIGDAAGRLEVAIVAHAPPRKFHPKLSSAPESPDETPRVPE